MLLDLLRAGGRQCGQKADPARCLEIGEPRVTVVEQAARLVPLFGQGGFAFLPDLEANARHEADEIGQSARRAIGDLSRLYRDASEGDRQAYAATIDRIANLPEALAPTTHRGFDLRDLARACKRETEKG